MVPNAPAINELFDHAARPDNQAPGGKPKSFLHVGEEMDDVPAEGAHGDPTCYDRLTTHAAKMIFQQVATIQTRLHRPQLVNFSFQWKTTYGKNMSHRL